MTLKCTMILGDCLDVLPAMPEARMQMVFCDFPYGKKTLCHWDVVIPLETVIPMLRRVLTPAGGLIATAVQPFTSAVIASAPRFFRYTLVWNKNVHGAPSTARYRPLAVHEDVCVFGSTKTPYNPQMTARLKPQKLTAAGNKCLSLSSPIANPKPEMVGKIYTEKFPTSIIHASCRLHPRGLHPTQKPVALLDWLIRTYSNEGDTVLDPVSGSGTTAVAAASSGRHSVCIEKDEGYFAAGVERVRKHIRDNGIDAKVEVRK